ncbi:TetR family transcriptional regulator [Aureimonas sp. SA4125]|uniref:TetR/AcrR family transcriptional regulator n=1 Tax=Aureimonas sp. SA4125 TaxID=2826993 RepID=UPI001CC5BB98|nr:TetR/AcrR family transcriptional regulator [Aureimonas sp. SA4125]BDA84652.1 TetR family transcriptional regulator [Aureimonas sp. SA4125]
MEMTEPKRRGRPPLMSADERRGRIVVAAEEVFTSKGYSTASMDDVVRACGMSKKTVYETFHSKEQIFHQIVTSSLDQAPRLDEARIGQACGEVLLRDVLRSMAAFILSPRQVALTRLVFTESQSAPEIAKIFFEVAVVRGQARLAETIRRIGGATPAGGRQSEELADLMVGTLLGPGFFSAILGLTVIPTQDEIHERIDWLLAILRPTLALKKQP